MSVLDAAGCALSSVPVGVGGADDPVPAPRDDEQHALLGAQDQPGRGLDPVARHDQVDALGRADVELPALADQRLGVVGPHAGRVDHLLGADLVDLGRVSRSATRTPVTRSPSRRKPTTRARLTPRARRTRRPCATRNIVCRASSTWAS